MFGFLKKISAERVAGAIFILIGIFSIVESFRLRPMRVRGVVGDDTLPLIIGVILSSLGIIKTFVAKPPPTKVVFPKGKVAGRIIGSMGILFAYWACLSYLGYLISTSLCSIVLFKLFSNYHWHTILIASTLMTFSMYLIFSYFLKMPFPIGVLGILRRKEVLDFGYYWPPSKWVSFRLEPLESRYGFCRCFYRHTCWCAARVRTNFHYCHSHSHDLGSAAHPSHYYDGGNLLRSHVRWVNNLDST